MGVLDEIIAHKWSEVEDRRARYPIADLQAASRGLSPSPKLATILRPRPPQRVSLIAEVKRASPSRGLLKADLDPVAQAQRYAAAGAAVISVLTDARYFHGSLDDLVAVRAAVRVPLLRKEFIVHEYQLWESRAAGADAVLLIVGALEQTRLADLLHAATEIGLGTLVEVHSGEELERALRLDAPVVGVNNRDLQTLATGLEPSLRLLPLIPRERVAVSESGLFTAADVERVVAAGAHAILVGEGLVRAGDVEAKARELLLGDAVPRLAGRASAETASPHRDRVSAPPSAGNPVR